MANIKSAIKRAQIAKTRQLRNAAVKSTVRTTVRRVTEAITAGDAIKGTTALSAAFSIIDKAATKGVLHKKNAARKKARLAKHLAAAAK